CARDRLVLSALVSGPPENRFDVW
nr:immunoglobulin heavy chain junction region [Macaca mulatta]